MPLIWAGVIAGGASLASGALGAQAAGEAADTLSNSAGAAAAEQARQYNQTREDLLPYRQLGTPAVRRLADLLGLQTDIGGPTPPDPEQFRSGYGASRRWDEAGYLAAMSNYGKKLKEFRSKWQPMDPNAVMAMDPGYQFRLGQGEKAITRAATAAGNRYSGATLKELLRYGQDYASGEFGQVYNRLAGAAGTGQAATTQTGMLGANYANQLSNLITGAGSAQAAGQMGQANAWGQAIGTGANTLSQLLMAYRSQPQGGNVLTGAQANPYAYDLMANAVR